METLPDLNDQAGASQWGRRALIVYIGIIILTIVVADVGVFRFGWWPASPRNIQGFGVTPAQCEAAYGHPVPGSFMKPQASPRSVWYVAQGWYILVGYDEDDRAEKFIFSKANLPFFGPTAMTAAQQSGLLDKLKQGSTWDPSQSDARGSLWNRNDGQAAAFYLAGSRLMIFMNKAGWDRFNSHQSPADK